MPDADEHLLHELVRIAPTGLSLERYDDLTLVAALGNVSKSEKQYVDGFMNVLLAATILCLLVKGKPRQPSRS